MPERRNIPRAVAFTLLLLVPLLVVTQQPAVAVSVPPGATQVDGGHYYTCARYAHGVVRCFGYGAEHSYEGGDATQVAAGWNHACALLATGDVTCWGSDDYGQSASYTGGDAVQVDAARAYTCALLRNGNVHCWGSLPWWGNWREGELHAPEVEGYDGGDAIGVTASRTHTCALLSSGNVHCWGPGTGLWLDDYQGGDAVQVAAASHWTCVLLERGSVHCWGYDYSTNVERVESFGSEDAMQISVEYSHLCALLKEGHVQCWKLTEDGDRRGKSDPYLRGDALQVSVGTENSCVIREGGRVHCWGDDYDGQSDEFGRPDAPRYLEAKRGASFGEVRLNWDPPSYEGMSPLTGYRVYRSQQSGAHFELIGSTTATHFTDEGLGTGPYYYVVSAMNSHVESEDSRNEASILVVGEPAGVDDFDESRYEPEAASGHTPFGGATLRPPYPASTREGTVNLASGEFVATFPLMSVTNHRGDDFRFELTYRSMGNGDGNGALSWGWDANWLQRLQPNGDGYDHLTGDGRTLPYTPMEGGWKGPPGTYSMLTAVEGKLQIEDRHGNRKLFDPGLDHKLTEVVDAADNAWRLTYDATNGTLTSILDPHGRKMTLAYNSPSTNPFHALRGEPLLTSITDFTGRRASILHDHSTGRIVAVAAPGPEEGTQRATHFMYDAKGRLQIIADHAGQATLRMRYDGFGRTVGQVLPQGSGFFFDYYHQDGLTFVWDGLGRKVEWRFMHEGDAVPRNVPRAKLEHASEMRPSDQALVTLFTYNTEDEPTSVTWPAGNGILYKYDEGGPFFSRGNLLEETRAPGPVRTLGEEDRPSNVTTLYEYDRIHNVVTGIMDPRGSDPSYVPPNGGNVSPDRYTTTIYYDFHEAALGDLNGDGVTNQNARNPVRIVYPTVNPAGAVVHPAFTTDYAGQTAVETLTWNEHGQLLTRRDPSGTVESRTYHATGSTAGYLQSIAEDPTGLNLTTTYGYNDFGAITNVTDPNGNVRTFEVDQRGRVTEEVGPAPTHYRTRWTYDHRDNVLSVARETDAGTGTFALRTFEYDVLDRLVAETVHAAKSPAMDAAVAGQGPPPPESYTAHYLYDAIGNLVRYTDGAGGVTSWQYDERNLVVQASGPDGGTFTYDDNGNPAAFTDQRGNTTRYQYDGHDRPSVEIDPLGNVFVTNYGPAGNIVRERGFEAGPFGPTLYDRLYAHDEAGQMYRMDAWHGLPAGASKASTSNTLSPDDDWVTTLYERDPRGLVTRIIDDNGQVTTKAYDAAGRESGSEDPAGNTVEYTYDPNGNIITVAETDVDGDGANPLTFVTTSEYDSENRRTLITNPDGTTRAFTYDGRGNVVQTIDEAGHTITTFYDDADRPWLMSHRVDDTTYVNTTTHWDGADRPVKKCDGLDACTTYEYVPATQLVAVESPEHLPGVSHSYGPNGNRIRTEYGNGKAITMTYDALNRRTAVDVMPDAQTIGTLHQTFTYDAMGRLIRATDDGVVNLGTGVATALSQTVLAQRFDTLGRVVTESQNFLTVHHTRDGVGNIVASSYPTAVASADLSTVDPTARVVFRTYDEANQLDRVWDVKGIIADYAHHGSRAIEKLMGGPTTASTPLLRTEFSYDTMRRPIKIDHFDASGTLSVGFETRYDAVGNRVAERWSPSTARQHGELFTLDTMGRTTSWQRGAVNEALDDIAFPVQESTWDVDARNDWTSWSPDAASGETCTRSTSAAAIQETCSTGATTAFQRDLNGNLMDDGTYTYHWDFLNRLVRVEEKATGDLVVGYAYDAFDRRVVKVFPGQEVSTGLVPPQQGEEEAWYTYAGQHVIQESRPVSTIGPPEAGAVPVHVIRQWTYGSGVDEVLEMSTDQDGDQITTGAADARHFYHLNALGTVIGLTGESGQLVEGYTYDAYGEVTVRVPGSGSDRVWWDDFDTIVPPEPNGAPRSPSGNIWFFTGRQLDPETGTYHYRARNYHPYLGQFISMDPLGVWGDPGNLGNPYVYVGNNPGTYRDPSGLYAGGDDAAACGVGAVAALAVTAVSDLFARKASSRETYAGQAVGGCAGGTATLYAGPVGGGAVYGAVSSATTYGLEVATGSREGSLAEVATTVAIGTGAGAAGGALAFGAGKAVQAGLQKGTPAMRQLADGMSKVVSPQKGPFAGYPPKRGFVDTPGHSVLLKGARIDRYGDNAGRFVSPEGTPFPERSLPQRASKSAYSVFEVVEPFEVKAGQAAPWYGQPGGGVQYELPLRVEELLAKGLLRRVGP